MAMDTLSKVIKRSAVAAAMLVAMFPGAAIPASAGDHGGAYLGVMVDTVSPETAAALHLKSGGASIDNVDQDGPACRAGLKDGDIVISYNGKAVNGSEQFANLIHSSAPGSTVTLTVVRSGQTRDVKVVLGDWKQMAHMQQAPLSPVGSTPATPPPPLPPRSYPEFDFVGTTPISARHGVLVEPLCPQLSEFFGVPQNKGVMVRTVEKGSPGAAAGLKAGDVILRVNNEIIHDTADWRRAMKGRGKLSLAIMRDKKEMNLQMNLPGDTSELNPRYWDGFGIDAATLAMLNQEQMDEIHRQVESASRTITPEMRRQAADLHKQAEEIRNQTEAAARAMTPEMKKQAEEMRRQAVVIRQQTEQMRKDIEKMTPEMAKSAREMAESMKPTAKELSDMARDMAQQWKEMQPELQKQMDEMKKQMEQEKREWQEIFKGNSPKQL